MANTSVIYRRGSRGPVVGEIQTMLGKGYTDLNGVVDNNYGPITRDAVWNWQTQWNNANPNDQIKVDGKVGPETLPRLTQWYQAQQPQQTVVGQQKSAEEPAQPVTPATTPKIDTTNAMGSLAEILGPTPAEREAREEKRERNRQQMNMWAGLFDGLRHLGNLYYTSKGATPQQLENPYKQIDENYQRDIKRLDDMIANRQKYAHQLYSLQRQAREDKRHDMLAEAQAKWYGTRDNIAQQKAEYDRYNYKTMSNGSIIKIDKEDGTVTEISPADPDYVEWKKSQTYRNYHPGTGGKTTSGEKTTRTRYETDSNGNKIKIVEVSTGNAPRGQGYGNGGGKGRGY